VEEVCTLPPVDTAAGTEAAAMEAASVENDAAAVEAASGTIQQPWKPHLWTPPQLWTASHARMDSPLDPTEHVSIASRQPMSPSAQQEQPATSEPVTALCEAVCRWG